MVFAQFYSERNQHAVGSSQVAVLNGRHGLATHTHVARALCRAQGFIGFDIRKGESFTRASIIREVEYLDVRSAER